MLAFVPPLERWWILYISGSSRKTFSSQTDTCWSQFVTSSEYDINLAQPCVRTHLSRVFRQDAKQIFSVARLHTKSMQRREKTQTRKTLPKPHLVSYNQPSLAYLKFSVCTWNYFTLKYGCQMMHKQRSDGVQIINPWKNNFDYYFFFF